MKDEHEHKWHTTDKPNHLECTVQNCNTVTSLVDALANAASDAAIQAKVQVLTTQLRNGYLKKNARDIAYSFVRSHGIEGFVHEQESLL
ncbi:MAG TPA: hypothetical protein VJ841_03420 [Candidatus Saccharimonadales bacterium]|nr:hypothetical protein [Candidatus Saccharimonadales bacterium]